MVLFGLFAVPTEGLAEEARCWPTVGTSDRGFAPVIARKIRVSESMKTGAAGDALVRELVVAMCRRPDVGSWLPELCKSPGEAGIEAVQRRLVRDLASIPRAALGRGSAKTLELRLLAASLDALLHGASPSSLAAALGPPAADTRCVPRVVDREDSVSIAGLLILSLQSVRGTEDGVAIVRRTFHEAGLRQDVSEADVRRLVGALDRLRTLPRNGSLAPFVAALLDTLEAAMRLATDRPDWALDPGLGRMLRSFVDRPGSGVLDGVLSLVGPAAGISDSADAIRRLLRLFSARDEAEARRIVRGALLGVGPWSDRILFDINVGLPRLETRDFAVAGDLLAGYDGERFGGAARGSVGRFDLVSEDVVADTLRAAGSGEVWLLLHPSRVVQLEARLAGGGALYETTRVDPTGTTTNVLQDEVSVMGRGEILAAVRVQPSRRWAFGLWAGVGLQREFYDTVRVPASGAAVFVDEQRSTSLLTDFRSRWQFEIVPRWLAVRVRGDLLRYGVTRDSLATVIRMGQAEPTLQKERGDQLELAARVFLDLEAARFFGFVPSVSGGIDYVRRSVEGPDLQTLEPIFGAGIRRVAF